MHKISALVVVSVGAFIVSSGVAIAAGPTQADFDACNQMAQSKVSSPSASPQSATRAGEQRPSSNATPQAAPSPESAEKARVENQADQLRGISDVSKDDPAFQQAYRDCMKRRGF